MDAATISSTQSPDERLTFRARHRLSGARQFALTHREGIRKPRGPLVVIGRPNDLPHCRLGLSVSRRVGNAVKRHAIKRRVREAFRLSQHDLPPGYDLVVIVRPHTMMPMQRYLELLTSASCAIDATWRKRSAREDPPDSSS